MNRLFRLSGSKKHEPKIDEWLSSDPITLYAIARHWFEQMRECGNDVTELIHDGCPVACVEDAAFAYVNVFSTHVNVGFYTGAALDDPAQLLFGSGKRMRHVKILPGSEPDANALATLIQNAYRDVKGRLTAD